MGSRPLSVLFAGGGTGGHLFPAVAVADEIRRRDPAAVITFVGTRGKIEARVVPALGYGFHTIWISGFRRRLEAATFLFPVKVIVSMVQSLLLLKQIAPQVVVGTGGYVCGPVVFAASLLGIPTLIHEQNSSPGVTTRLLAGRATEVHLTFEDTRRHLARKHGIVVSGNPTRASIGAVPRAAGADAFGLDPGRTTLLVFGGSLGAHSINVAMSSLLPRLPADIQVLWQTGEEDFAWIEGEHPRSSGRGVVIRRFIDRMEHAYAAADLVVCRSGATTLAELTRAGIASVLVPYPHAAGDHQTANARAMVDAGAAVMIEDAGLPEALLPALQRLLADREARAHMAGRARALGRPDAGPAIASAVLNLAGRAA